MAARDWNAAYEAGSAPWDTGTPSPQLIDAVASGALPSGRALEVGCGSGTNSVWLAEQGYDVFGVDVARFAIEQATAKASAARVTCRFEVKDFLTENLDGKFDLAFDRGCFHTFDHPDERANFAARIAACLSPGGMWLSLIGSTEGGPREMGPPRRTAREVLDAIEPVLELVELRSIEFHLSPEYRPNAWFCLSRVRDVEAVASSLR